MWFNREDGTTPSCEAEDVGMVAMESPRRENRSFEGEAEAEAAAGRRV